MRSPRVVVLGAGTPFSGSDPSAIQHVSGDERALDWTLRSFSRALDNPEFHFVGGYLLEEVVTEYPDVHFSLNEAWKDTGTVGSLLSAPLSADRPTYVFYADTVFDVEAVSALSTADGPAAIAIDSEWTTRYRDRDRESLERAEKVILEDGALSDIGSDLDPDASDAEFTGLVRLSPEAVDLVGTLAEDGRVSEMDDLPALVARLADQESVSVVDIDGNWAELETPDDVARFVLDTKANTLRRLSSVVTEGTILDQHTFRVVEWERDPDAVCADIERTFGDQSVIVRSSTIAEDTWAASNAGRFESVLDVPAADVERLRAAIEQVVDSYPTQDDDEQVLVQPMVTDVRQSGVVMTRTVDTQSPYYVVNYDPETGSTGSVTDGSGETIRTAYLRRDAADDPASIPRSSPQAPTDLPMEALVRMVREVEDILNYDSLDVEFAVDAAGEIFLLQVRPIALDPGTDGTDDEVFRAVNSARERFGRSQAAPPHVLGDRTIYGVMPDWNPAEMIGRRPGLLATSLYRYLITDDVWARQRAEFGYRDVRPEPLLTTFAGQPYVDVRAVFNSFVPASLPDDLAAALVEYYVEYLDENPHLHDKVEFDVAFTCLSVDFDDRAARLRKAGFDEEDVVDLRDALEGVTRQAIERVVTGVDMAEIETLEASFDRIRSADLPPLRAARSLLADCRRFGTLPFAHLARSAFVATSLLRSLRRTGALTEADVAEFHHAIETVPRRFEHDGYRVAAGELSMAEFVDTYGHLRPGTYDITSPTYRQDPETYLKPMIERASPPPHRPAPADVWGTETAARVEDELAGVGLSVDAERFTGFLREAIAGREYAKFAFTRNLSAALEAIADFGAEVGCSREQLSHVSLRDVLSVDIAHPPGGAGQWLAARAREGRRRHDVSTAAELPALLTRPADFVLFERPSREPNFVTTGAVQAEPVPVDADPDRDLDGAIAAIPRADPGYDWLFGHDVAGLITTYGGSNSHMAVRAAEFGLPAAIGVGEDRYERLASADLVELDCASKVVRRIR